MLNKQTFDQVILIDERDQQIGVMDKVKAHKNPAKLHRASSIYLFRKGEDGIELLIQRRSNKKIVGANQWANTVCVNVRPGESYQEAAYRRLDEELGIKQAVLDNIYTFRYQIKCNQEFGENEIDHVFVGWYDEEVVLNKEEVIEVEWVNFDQLNNINFDLTPWFELMLEDKNLVNKIEKWLQGENEK